MKPQENNTTDIAVEARERLLSLASETQAEISARFFKTAPGEYGEGDRFIGVKMPQLHALAREYARLMTPTDVLPLLTDAIHECRMLALLVWIRQFSKSQETTRLQIYSLYLSHTAYINNWDLVDLSAYKIMGEYLLQRDRSELSRLAESASLWEQRIAIVSTFAFIRRNDFAETLRIADMLLRHKHDLIHKAVGWMLREVGKHDKDVLTVFLETRCGNMPRTMLRYAIERFSPAERAYFMRK